MRDYRVRGMVVLALLLAGLAAYSLYVLQVAKVGVKALVEVFLYLFGTILVFVVIPWSMAKVCYWFIKTFHLERPIKRESLDYEEVEAAACTPRPIDHTLPSLAVEVLHLSGPRAKPDGRHEWWCIFKPIGEIPAEGGWMVIERTFGLWYYNGVTQRWERVEYRHPYANPQWEAYRIGDTKNRRIILVTGRAELSKPKSPYIRMAEILEDTVRFYAGDVKLSRYKWRGKIPSGLGWDRDWEDAPQDYGWEIYRPRIDTDRGNVISTAKPATDVRPPFWDGCGTPLNMAMYWDGASTWGAIQWGNKVHHWGQPPAGWVPPPGAWA